jgi:hypothetical protein
MSKGNDDLNFNIDIENKNKISSVEVKNEEEPKKETNEKKGNSNNIIQVISHANHPIVCLFTILFKITSITSFILLNIFLESEALVYLLVIILASCDFWVTKNVSGRLLVGLRWWNEVRADGNEVWIFESKNEIVESTADSRVFWTSLYISTGIWFLIVLWDFISFKWIWGVIAIICCLLSVTNLYGYLKCSKKQQGNLSKFGAKAVMKVISKGKDIAVNEATK